MSSETTPFDKPEIQIKKGAAFHGIPDEGIVDLLNRGDFLMCNDWHVLSEDLGVKQKAFLWDAVFQYQAGNDTIFSDSMLNGVFRLIKSKFDRNAKEYLKTLNARRKGGVQGGRPKKP